ncbi:MAG TPA: cytochrome c oxidase subunit II [Solirubrobacteraceae bacterium]|jgi:cytochrome c oxidase subunit 2|nr:cytochrome c oxidase subunit II [Solirubrobacteraceae bacterium]
MSHLLPTTLASFFTPQSGASPNAQEIDTLYKIVLYVAIVIFIGVEGALGYALYKFRKRKGAVAAQIHGNTRLEIGWTLGAAAIVLVLTIITFVKLSSIENPPNSSAGGDVLAGGDGELYATADKHLPPDGKSLEIEVIGRQFIWQYVYPGATNPDGLGAPYSYEEMVVPTKTTVTLDIVSSDVVHAWWVPALGGKFQAVPGYHNYTWFKIEKPGVFHGQCAYMCGRGHARMIATVRAVEPAQFDEWLANQRRDLEEAKSEAAKERARLNSQTGPAQVANP